MLSQFTPEGANRCLSDLDFIFPRDVYPLGRLDSDSEGLILLSNDPSMNQALLPPDKSHWRQYLAQVEGSITKEACSILEKGVLISVKGKSYKTLPCRAQLTEIPNNLLERVPPVRFRQNTPTSWLLLELKEGKNRQVRKMTATAGFPTLRLIRIAIADLRLEDLVTGMVYTILEFLDTC